MKLLPLVVSTLLSTSSSCFASYLPLLACSQELRFFCEITLKISFQLEKLGGGG